MSYFLLLGSVLSEQSYQLVRLSFSSKVLSVNAKVALVYSKGSTGALDVYRLHSLSR